MCSQSMVRVGAHQSLQMVVDEAMNVLFLSFSLGDEMKMGVS
jgi:hypothetical protein